MNDSIEFEDVFRTLHEWARASEHGVSAGSGREGFHHIRLHFRPDPRGRKVELVFRARLVEGRPVIVVSRSPNPTAALRSDANETAATATATSVVTFGMAADEESLGRDPAAVCEGCGAMGTAGQAARTDATGAVTEMHGFCAACWPEQAARYRARWEEENRLWTEDILRGRAAAGAGRAMWFQAATWHWVLDAVRQAQRAMSEAGMSPSMEDDLARLAAVIRQRAPELEGEMPFEVEAFLQQYGAPG